MKVAPPPSVLLAFSLSLMVALALMVPVSDAQGGTNTGNNSTNNTTNNTSGNDAVGGTDTEDTTDAGAAGSAGSGTGTSAPAEFMGMDRGAWTIVITLVFIVGGFIGVWAVNRTPGKGPRHP